MRGWYLGGQWFPLQESSHGTIATRPRDGNSVPLLIDRDTSTCPGLVFTTWLNSNRQQGVQFLSDQEVAVKWGVAWHELRKLVMRIGAYKTFKVSKKTMTSKTQHS